MSRSTAGAVSPIMTLLFVYGTLRRGQAPRPLASIVGSFEWLGSASVAGRLHDFGRYPGAVLEPGGDRRIQGELARLPEDPGVLRVLDRYEGFDPADLAGSLFRRVRCTARDAEGAAREAWIYVYNRDPAPAPLIEGGVYTGRGRSGSMGSRPPGDPT